MCSAFKKLPDQTLKCKIFQLLLSLTYLFAKSTFPNDWSYVSKEDMVTFLHTIDNLNQSLICGEKTDVHLVKNVEC